MCELNKKKIIFISPSFYPATYYGGSVYSSYNLAKALAQFGCLVDIITTNSNGKARLKVATGRFIDFFQNIRIKYYKAIDSRGTSIELITNIKNDILQAQIVYVISVFSPTTPFSIYFCNKLNRQLLICPNGELGSWCLNQGSRFKKLWLMLFINPFADKIFWHATSTDEEKMIKLLYPNAKTIVLPNVIDMNEFRKLPDEKNKKFFDKYTAFDCSNKKIIVSMGRLHKVKGFDILIEAFAKLLKSLSNAVLFIVGENFGEQSKLEILIENYQLKNKVFLVGKVEGFEKLEFLHNSDVFALASHHENFGMVYAEALAAGTPIVASKNTPWKEVEKYNCGKWVENTPAEFEDAFIEIFRENTIKMGENGKKFIYEEFGWEKISENFSYQLNKILNEK